jgi:hypothetical protein
VCVKSCNRRDGEFVVGTRLRCTTRVVKVVTIDSLGVMNLCMIVLVR